MSNYIRIQVLLDKKQRTQLDEIARKQGISFSELVRDFLDAQMRIRAYEDMRRAAQQLVSDYANDISLTDMTALDGEDFING
jgi:metal-responsive CopG/Arc/MetJ family transcriptional regulator